MSWQGTFLTLGAVVLAVYIYGLRLPSWWATRKLPRPKAVWMLGNSMSFLGLGQIMNVEKFAQEYKNKPFALSFGARSAVMISDAENGRKVLQDLNDRTIYKEGLGIATPPQGEDPSDGILWARGRQWKKLRNAWQCIFYGLRTHGFLDVIDEAAMTFCKKVKQASDGPDKYIDVEPFVQNWSLDVITQAAFGYKLDPQELEHESRRTDKEVLARSTEILQAVKAYMMLPPLSIYSLFAIIFPFLAPVLRMLAAKFPDKPMVQTLQSRNRLQSIVDQLMADHRSISTQKECQKPHSSLRTDKKVVRNKSVRPGSFIDFLVQEDLSGNEQFTANEKAQQVMFMLMAGHDTTACTCLASLFLLAKPSNAKVQEKLVAEVDRLGKEYQPDYESLQTRTPFLEATLMETLRLYPPIANLFRETSRPFQINEYILPKKQMIYVCGYTIHHSKSVWGDLADEFRPERWLHQNPDSVHMNKQNFFAFGAGARQCPGSKLALLELKILLIRILQNFTLHLGPNQEPPLLRATLTFGLQNLFLHMQPRKQ